MPATSKRETRLALAGLLFALYYYASPYFTEHGLKAAIRTGNADRIAAYVDFLALRQSTKDQIARHLADKLGYGNGIASVAGLLPGSKEADARIDSTISRDGLTRLLAQASGNPDAATQDLLANTSDGFAGLTRFRITVNPDNSPPVNLYLQRGLLSWKVAEVEIPDALFDRLQDGNAANLAVPAP